ncbi:MAG: SDR family NAD(P)-dependent oxidoreductase [Candidatus Xenobium sp.]|jgi:NAD(P)-dependent dehydrogenase (short-subunit alcohol dehydrogenase family)|nr:SDR family oxidoreductase [Burkholderiales bacterium]
MRPERIAVVTGASQGLGLAVVRGLLGEGYRVALTGRSAERLRTARQDLPEGARVLVIQADVAEEAEVLRTFDQVQEAFGTPDLVVNNAGQAWLGEISSTSLEDWNRCLAVHATGTFLMCREAIRRWTEPSKAGCLINVASVSARTGAPLAAAYCAAKAAVLGLTRSLAREVANRGIRVNAVCPGAMDTPMFHEGTLKPLIERFGRDRETMLRSTLAQIPMRRLLDPGEVADLVVWLASDSARGITGQSFNVDGGLDMR